MSKTYLGSLISGEAFLAADNGHQVCLWANMVAAPLLPVTDSAAFLAEINSALRSQFGGCLYAKYYDPEAQETLPAVYPGTQFYLLIGCDSYISTGIH